MVEAAAEKEFASMASKFNSPTNSPGPVPSPASTSDISGNPTNSPESNDPWSGYYWLREANKPIPEHAPTFGNYIEAPIQEDLLLIQEDPPSSDSQPSTYILSPCTTPPPVDSSPEHPPQRRPDDCFGMLDIVKYQMSTASEWGEQQGSQHSPPSRSDPDLLALEEVTPGSSLEELLMLPNQESVSLGPDAETSQSAARHPVECSQSTSSKKRKSNHPQKESNKRIRTQSTASDTESAPIPSSRTVDSTADGSLVTLVTEDQEASNSSRSSDED